MNYKNDGLDINLVPAMLDVLSPNLSYQDWQLIGRSLYSEFGDEVLGEFHDWSKGGTSYSDEDFNRHWKNIARKHQKVTIGSFIYLAMQAGFKFPKNEYTPEQLEEFRANRERRKKEQEARLKELWAEQMATLASQEIYFNGLKDTQTVKPSPFLVKKKMEDVGQYVTVKRGADKWGRPFVARAIFDQLFNQGRFGGFEMILDKKNSHGNDKFSSDDADTEHCFTTFATAVAKTKPVTKIIIVGAFADAYAVFLATQEIVVSPVGEGQIPRIAAQLKKQHPGAEIIIAPDNDKAGRAVIDAAGGRWALPTAEGADWSDVYLTEGLDAVAAQVSRVRGYDRQVSDGRYIQCRFTRGMNLIKAPMGSGKSTNVKQFIADNPGLKVLIISHRRQLLSGLSGDLQADYYEDMITNVRGIDPNILLKESRRLVITLDSLHRLQGSEWDVIFFDECEQGLRHLINSDMAHAENALALLAYFLTHSRYQMLADARLGELTWWFTNYIGKESGTYHLNTFQNGKGKTLYVYESPAHFNEDWLQHTMAGECNYLYSNSKRQVKTFGKELQKLAARVGSNGKAQYSGNLFMVHSELSATAQVRETLTALKYVAKQDTIRLKAPVGSAIMAKVLSGQASVSVAKVDEVGGVALYDLTRDRADEDTVIDLMLGADVFMHLDRRATLEQIGWEPVHNGRRLVLPKALDNIIASPTLGTGFDIPHHQFATVYGHLVSNSGTSDEAHQGLNRARNVNTMRVYLDPAERNHPTDPDVIHQLVIDQLSRETCDLLKIDWRTGEASVRDHFFESLYCQAKAQVNKSLNNFKGEFLRQAIEEGYSIVHVKKDDKKASFGQDALDEARETTNRELLDELNDTRLISEDELTAALASGYGATALEVEKAKVVKDLNLREASAQDIDELHSLAVDVYSQFAEQGPSPEDTPVPRPENAFDAVVNALAYKQIKDHYVSRIKKLSLLNLSDDAAKALDINSIKHSRSRTSWRHMSIKKRHMVKLLGAAGLDEQLNYTGKQWSKGQINDILQAWLKRNQESLYKYSGVALSETAFTDPLQWLHGHYRSYGLIVEAKPKRRIAGALVNLYGLQEQSLAHAKVLVELRNRGIEAHVKELDSQLENQQQETVTQPAAAAVPSVPPCQLFVYNNKGQGGTVEAPLDPFAGAALVVGSEEIPSTEKPGRSAEAGKHPGTPETQQGVESAGRAEFERELQKVMTVSGTAWAKLETPAVATVADVVRQALGKPDLSTEDALGAAAGVLNAHDGHYLAHNIKRQPVQAALKAHLEASLELPDGLMAKVATVSRGAGVGALLVAHQLTSDDLAQVFFGDLDDAQLGGLLQALAIDNARQLA